MTGVLVHTGSNEVGTPAHDEIDVLFEPEDVFRLQEGCLQEAAQLVVCERRHTAILVGVLEPEEPRVVASPSYLQRIRPGIVFAGRIDHQIRVVSHALACLEHGLHFPLDRPVPPAVNLERRVSQIPTLQGEICEGLR